jgi:hypothetical protein
LLLFLLASSPVGRGSLIRATPLHGLGTVFQSQRPEVYEQTVSQVAKRASELRSGTSEDLRRMAKSQSAEAEPPAETTEPVRPPSGTKGKIRADAARGKAPRGEASSGDPEPIRRQLQANSTRNLRENLVAGAQAQMQARELVEVLAYFNAENVNWDGHMGPNCDYAGFRRVALRNLPNFGNIGAEAVVQAVGEELTGVTIPREVKQSPVRYVGTFNSVYAGQARNPLTRDRAMVTEPNLPPERIVQQTLLMNPTYHGDLVALLKKFHDAGLLTSDLSKHLKTCMAGKKPKELRQFAADVARAMGLSISPDTPLADLVDNLAKATDSVVRKKLLAEVPKRLPAAGVLELLRVLDAVSDEGLRRAVVAQLSARQPTYKAIEKDLPEILRYAGSSKSAAAAAAREQVANAFQRAPMAQCLETLAQVDGPLGALIWRQVDGRIARAGPEKLAEYRRVAAALLEPGVGSSKSKAPAVELLGRMKDDQSVDELIAALPGLPSDLWVKAGETLQAATGQDFGPKSGDGAPEVQAALRKWRAWQKERGAKQP